MTTAGVLTAERDGPNIKFGMSYPDGIDHSFSVERLDTNPAGETSWTPIMFESGLFVRSDTAWEMAPLTSDGSPPQPLPGPRSYRALVHALMETSPSGVSLIQTDGVHSDVVVVN